MNRRELLRLMGAGALAGCAGQNTPPEESSDPSRIDARPRKAAASGGVGTFPLRLGTGRDGLLYVPRAGTLPLVLMLHGAGGVAERVLQKYRGSADEFGFIILAPESRDTTWDVVRGEFGEDIRFINRALERVFTDYAIDPRHLAIAGFSDGASYALSVGITNGDLFSHVMAFSPGFAVPAARHGLPLMFISHGTEDEILPIDRTSRRLVPRLREAGYFVQYVEFEGPHRVPDDIAHHAFAWFAR